MMKSVRDSELPGSSPPLALLCPPSPDPSLGVPEYPILGQVPLLVSPAPTPALGVLIAGYNHYFSLNGQGARGQGCTL